MSRFPEDQETRRHEFLDEFRFALRVVLALFTFITLILLATEQHMALVSGVALVVLLGLFILVDLAERRTRPRGLSRVHAPPTDEAPESPAPAPAPEPAIAPTTVESAPAPATPEAETEEAVRGETALRTALQLAAGVGVIAVGLAALLLGWRMLGMGVLLFFAYLSLFGAPYWIAAIHQRGDDAREHLPHS